LAVIAALGVPSLTVDITKQVDAYFESFPDAGDRRRGNKMARERMTILYDHSARWSALVLGTSNKTELLLGYGTLHGDMASAVNPLGDLYKTQVWALAGAVGVPASVIHKNARISSAARPTVDLGFTYRELDDLTLRWST
jgi:NAD+ synthase